MPAKFSVFVAVAAPALSFAIACGGDDDGGGIKIPDAGGQMDAPQTDCFVDSSYAPTFGTDTESAEESGSGATGPDAHSITWGGLLAMQPLDAVQLELYAGIGAFDGADISAKTIELTGDELNYKTCSVCVRIFADATQQSAAAQYFATGGTVTLSSVSGTLKGTLSNVTLTKVTVADDFTSTPVNDGCNTTITTATMNAPIEMAGSGSAASGEPSARHANGVRPLVITHRWY